MGRIYIVDDDTPVRESMIALLTLEPELDVSGFASAEDFMVAAPELRPGVVLLDYQMKAMNGLEVLASLASLRSRFAVVMLTAHGHVRLAVQAMKAGAVDFVEKPVDHRRLLEAIVIACQTLRAAYESDTVTAGARAQIARLSPRESEVLAELVRGAPNKVIAQTLDLSPRTVEIHRAKLMDKLQVRSLSQALRIAFDSGEFAVERHQARG